MKMRTIILVLSLIALAAPAQAAQKTHARHENQSLEQKCRAMVGKEQTEGEGRSHMGQMQAQRFGDCMIGKPNCSWATACHGAQVWAAPSENPSMTKRASAGASRVLSSYGVTS